MKISENEKKIKTLVLSFGFFVIFLGLLSNPYILAHLFSPDKHIENRTFIKMIFAFEIVTVLLGLLVILLSKSKWLMNFLCSFQNFLENKNPKKMNFFKKNKRIIKSTFFFFITILVLLFSTLFSAALLEIGVRIFVPSSNIQYARNDVVGSTLMPDMNGTWASSEFNSKIRTNSLGFRDINHQMEKPNGTFRVVIIGDSMVESLQVDFNKTFHQLLQKKLNEGGKRKYEVLAFGISGHGTSNEYLLLKNYALNFSPDIIILAFTSGNDLRNNNINMEYDQFYRPFFIENGSSLDLVYRNNPPEPSICQKVSWKFKFDWKSCTFLKQKLDTIKINADKRKRYMDEFVYAEPSPKEIETAWRITEKLILKAKKETEAYNASFVLISLTNPNQLYPPELEKINEVFNYNYSWDVALPEKTLQVFSDENNVTYFPFYYPFKDYVSKTNARLNFYHDFHWNEKGHAFAADVLYDYLNSTKLLPD
jgi:hypothetical protein